MLLGACWWLKSIILHVICNVFDPNVREYIRGEGAHLPPWRSCAVFGACGDAGLISRILHGLGMYLEYCPTYLRHLAWLLTHLVDLVCVQLILGRARYLPPKALARHTYSAPLPCCSFWFCLVIIESCCCCSCGWLRWLLLPLMFEGPATEPRIHKSQATEAKYPQKHTTATDKSHKNHKSHQAKRHRTQESKKPTKSQTQARKTDPPTKYALVLLNSSTI